MIVLDSGAYYESLVDSAGGATVADLMATEESAAPELFDAEVLHRIVRSRKSGLIDEVTSTGFVADLLLAPVERFRHHGLLRAAESYSAALSGYDALYVALAVVLGCTLVTTDRRLAETAIQQFGLTVRRIPTSGRSGA